MKIQALDLNSKKPLANTKIQIQVRGKDSGYYSYTTDASGNFELEDQFSGQQIAGSTGAAQGQWTAASDGAKLYLTGETATTSGNSKQTTQSYK